MKIKLWICENIGKSRVLEDEKSHERLISCGIEKGDKMKFDLDDWLVFELDWKAVAAIAVCVFIIKIITF